MILRTSAALLTSPWTKTASPPASLISCMVRSAFDRPLQTTLAPCLANATAVAWPMPLRAPVTMTTLPV